MHFTEILGLDCLEFALSFRSQPHGCREGCGAVLTRLLGLVICGRAEDGSLDEWPGGMDAKGGLARQVCFFKLPLVEVYK